MFKFNEKVRVPLIRELAMETLFKGLDAAKEKNLKEVKRLMKNFDERMQFANSIKVD